MTRESFFRHFKALTTALEGWWGMIKAVGWLVAVVFALAYFIGTGAAPADAIGKVFGGPQNSYSEKKDTEQDLAIEGIRRDVDSMHSDISDVKDAIEDVRKTSEQILFLLAGRVNGGRGRGGQ